MQLRTRHEKNHRNYAYELTDQKTHAYKLTDFRIHVCKLMDCKNHACNLMDQKNQKSHACEADGWTKIMHTSWRIREFMRTS